MARAEAFVNLGEPIVPVHQVFMAVVSFKEIFVDEVNLLACRLSCLPECNQLS